MTAPYDLGVVGGGIFGCSMALFAARAGLKVALVERGLLCREASGVNAGTLTMQMTRLALVPFALGGHAMWASAREWLGHDVGVEVKEGLSLAFTEQEEALLVERSAKRREAGAPIEMVTAVKAREIEPGLTGKVRAAAYCRIDGFANAYLTGMAFRRALLDAGVTVMERTPATGVVPAGTGYLIETAGGRIPVRRLVLTGGAWLEPMLAWLGIKLPMRVLVNQVAVTERFAPVMRTQLGIASGLLSLRQFRHGTVVIGGGWQGVGDPVQGPYGTNPDNLIANVRLACHAIPRLAGARLARVWSGLEAKTADYLPAIGPIPGHPDAWVCGACYSGFASGPFIGRLLVERMLGRETNHPLFPIGRLLAISPNTTAAMH